MNNAEEWDACDNPLSMLPVVFRRTDLSEDAVRRLRLFAVACWRSASRDPCFHDALMQLEELADGKRLVFDFEMDGFICATRPWEEMLHYLQMDLWDEHGDADDVSRIFRNRAHAADMIREVFGNPFRRPRQDARPEWLTPEIVNHATAIYWERKYEELPILADFVADQGCDDEVLLVHLRHGESHRSHCETCQGWNVFCGHCAGSGRFIRLAQAEVGSCRFCGGTGRQRKSPEHHRGCWALDRLTGRIQ